MGKELISGVAALMLALPAWPGEIIGNTYIGEKHGYIEVVSPDGKWQIEDREGRSNQIVELSLKSPINGTRPTILFFGIPKLDGMTIDMVIGMAREAIEKQGMELGPIESRRYAGKPIHAYSGSMTKNNQKAIQVMYVLEGPKTFFFVSASANSAAFDAAKPLFEEVVEKLKY